MGSWTRQKTLIGIHGLLSDDKEMQLYGLSSAVLIQPRTRLCRELVLTVIGCFQDSEFLTSPGGAAERGASGQGRPPPSGAEASQSRNRPGLHRHAKRM